MGRYIDLIGWSDCAHLQPPFTSQEELDEFERSLAPHQKQARKTGRPALGAGAIYPVNEDTFLVDPFPIPEHWAQGYAMDVGWNVTAGLLGAMDMDTGKCYLTHEYYGQQADPVIHASGIKHMLPWLECLGAMDPAAEGSNQKDGSKLRQEYEDLGLNLVRADNAVAAGIHVVLTMLQTGQLKVFNTLPYWLKEFRLYRRVVNEKSGQAKIVKKNDHLMDCTRYLMKTDGVFSTRPMAQARGRGYGEW